MRKVAVIVLVAFVVQAYVPSRLLQDPINLAVKVSDGDDKGVSGVKNVVEEQLKEMLQEVTLLEEQCAELERLSKDARTRAAQAANETAKSEVAVKTRSAEVEGSIARAKAAKAKALEAAEAAIKQHDVALEKLELVELGVDLAKVKKEQAASSRRRGKALMEAMWEWDLDAYWQDGREARNADLATKQATRIRMSVRKEAKEAEEEWHKAQKRAADAADMAAKAQEQAADAESKSREAVKWREETLERAKQAKNDEAAFLEAVAATSARAKARRAAVAAAREAAAAEARKNPPSSSGKVLSQNSLDIISLPGAALIGLFTGSGGTFLVLSRFVGGGNKINIEICV